MSLTLQAELNSEQLSAVTHGEGPQLVIAGAGSGKTRVITYRIAWLLAERKAWPHEVVAVTFTNKAAREMQERVERLLGSDRLETFVGTFHRFALRLLRRHGTMVGLPADFTIFDTEDQLQAVRRALEEEKLPEASFPPRALLAAISAAKNRKLDPEAYAGLARDFFTERAARVYARYQKILKQAGAVDFDDMLLLALRLFDEGSPVADKIRSRVRYLLVDEFQDTNLIQLELVRELVRPHQCLTAVGDEDQGIYRWRGADLTNVLEFERHFPGAVLRKLERNYRSTRNILAAANAVIAHNRLRRGKILWTDGAPGEPVRLRFAADETDEAFWVASEIERRLAGVRKASDFAVLVRTNAQTRAFEETFVRRGLPYTLVGGVRFYERAEIKDVLAYLRLVTNPRDNFSFRRILNQPPRGIGPGTLARLEERAREGGVALWEELVHGAPASYPARARQALERFRALIEDLRGWLDEASLPRFLRELLERTGYLAMLRSGGAEEAERIENLEEFLSAAGNFVSERGLEETPARQALAEFLDHVALVTDLDRWQSERGVTLMTLHSAKGLEFPVVFLPGLEEGMLPHINSIGEGPEALEEERRLFYVGMTRAMEELLVSHAEVRRVAGRTLGRTPSRFLEELPSERVEDLTAPGLYPRESARNALAFFGSDRSHLERPSLEPLRPANARPEGLPGRGQRVRHATLGEGVVLELEGSGPEAKVTVFFDRAGKRKLHLRFARLEEV